MEPSPQPSKGDRFLRAIELHHAHLAGEDPRSVDQMLRDHDDLRDLLEPLLCSAEEPGAAPAEAPDDAPDDAPDERRIGHYRVVRELGRGGMGVVYEAEQVALGRRVALKLLSAFALDERAVLRFRREAQLAASLDHPGITKVFDSGQHDGQPWYAMELVRGTTLAEVLTRLQPTAAATVSAAAFGAAVRDASRDASPGEPRDWHRPGKLGGGLVGVAVDLTIQIADALACAHAAGIVHRDVKPGNVIVRSDGSAKLTDFGIARSDDALSVTMTGDFAGTPSYASPEQQRGGRGEIDARSDVFSLAAMCYELLTLQRPFVGDTISELRARIERTDPRPPSRLNAHVPRDLDAIVLHAMEKAPDSRYPSAAAFADDLRRWRSGHAVAARPVGMATRTWRWCARNPIAAGFLAAVTGSLVVVLVLLAALTDSQATAQQRLDQFRSVKVGRDVRLLQEAIDGAPGPAPENAAVLQAVERAANDLLGQLPQLHQTLADLRGTGTPTDRPEPRRRMTVDPAADELARVRIDRGRIAGRLAELVREGRADSAWQATIADRLGKLDERAAQLQAVVDTRRRYAFADAATEYLHDSLEDAVAELDWLAETRVPELRRRTALAAQRTAELADLAERAEWRDARAVAAQPKPYGGLDLAPQPGLQPLGIDPGSGLLEFALVHTGRVPKRDPAGRLPFDGDTCVVLVLIPGGTAHIGAQRFDPRAAHFDRDASDNETRHDVPLDAYLLSKYELSHAQWNRMAAGLGVFHQCARFEGRAGFETKPIARVTWVDCDRLCRAHGLALPTEAQWEHACRAGTASRWWPGDDLDALLRCEDLANAYGGRVPCDDLLPNPFGLYHMHGNVQEWCADPMIDADRHFRDGDGLASGAVDGDQHAVRGAGYTSPPIMARSSARDTGSAFDQRDVLGLRPAMNLRRHP